mmetsp:Transcript_5800/g.17152  ORF Transcript_5800/g.17152 Transcript_5800/m.17152 type:complete len:448 (-) Transcript_5800:382-1725(-)
MAEKKEASVDAGRGLGWQQAGFIMFSFAAPSACTGVAYTFGMSGMAGGTIACLVVTAASIGGSVLLLSMRMQFPNCLTLGDLGFVVLGQPGRHWGNVIQLGNFVLFLPVALLLCATALEGVVDIPAFQGCSDYYILTVAAFCFATTQLRTLKNTQALALVSLVAVFCMSVLQIVAAFQYSVEQKVPARWFGNPKINTREGVVEAMLGATTTVWAYVPAFLTVELAGCMARPSELRKSLALSGVLNVAVFLVVGLPVVARWGYDVSDPITLTKVAAWGEGAALSKALSACLLVGNLVSYTLDSVPLGRFCQRSWAPEFADTWSLASVGRYALYTLPTWLFALFVSLAVPNLFVLLAFTTALTVPWVTQIYPAVLFLALHSGACCSLPHSQGQKSAKMRPAAKFGAVAILAVGCVSFVVCFAAAIGKVALQDLRGPSQIGCGAWIIWSS